ncbi:MAG TPA: putative toxin-antitoxin system toxin component, PIN family [Burkholderiales bacterium]|nr:putative toxin-antitoxin system toxin component, PIN family [Burkholderiales bacterium]
MKVFLDTNVLASGIATRGLCSELLESVIHDHELLTCQPVLRELERVLAQKFRLPEAVVAGFLALLKAEGTVVKSRKNPPIPIKDADDIPILACAIAGKADVFVTGDKELLDLRKIEDLTVVSPRELWNQLAGLEPGSQK